MARLFVEPARLAEAVVVITDADHRYLTRVLRLAMGDVLVLFDGIAVEADARIIRVGPRALELKIELRRPVAPSVRPDVTLLQALTKGDRFELVVQKATELGVNHIIPITCSRSIPRLEAMRSLSRHARWQKIAREAARQSGRIEVPDIEPVTPLHTALDAAARETLKLMIWEGARQQSLRAVLPTAMPARIAVAVGPEGGFEPDEVEAARRAGFVVVGLCPRILRTETAAVAIIAILGFALGDLA